jgi:hypothetical protein
MSIAIKPMQFSGGSPSVSCNDKKGGSLGFSNDLEIRVEQCKETIAYAYGDDHVFVGVYASVFTIESKFD